MISSQSIPPVSSERLTPSQGISQVKTGNRLARVPVVAAAKIYSFFFSIISCRIGVRMISIAKLILPPGTTRVLGRDMKES